ncbi:MAG TPA: hypothetical protein VM597_13425, partial [Gemmataceae bacterium]|nr:hypothetical protein [Gemmataceae bacterium]
PDFIVPAAPTPKPIDPVQVSAATDRSPALAAPPAPAPAIPAPPRRSIGWLVFPWAALGVMIVSAYLYLTKLDRTWDQNISEGTFVRGPVRVVEKPVEVVVEREKIVEKPVERIVEKPVERIVEKVVPAPAPADHREEQWASFAAEYRARMSRNEVTRAAEALQSWADFLPAWAGQPPPALAALQQDYRTAAPARLKEWAAAKSRQDLRFADAHEGISAFGGSPAVKALLESPKVAGVTTTVRAEVRDAEDQFHYDRIRSLLPDLPAGEERFQQHLTAYLALHNPPGRMLAEVARAVEYRDWIKKGRPVRGTVRISWGPRTIPGDYRLEMTFDRTKVTRTVSAKANDTWSDTFAVPADGARADGRIPYRIEIVRTTSSVEQLAEADRYRTEVFALDQSGPIEAAHEPESGTKVSVEWAGLLSPAGLPPWKGTAPVVPVSLPKKGGP